jgi:hypothetical protein
MNSTSNSNSNSNKKIVNIKYKKRIKQGFIILFLYTIVIGGIGGSIVYKTQKIKRLDADIKKTPINIKALEIQKQTLLGKIKTFYKIITGIGISGLVVLSIVWSGFWIKK